MLDLQPEKWTLVNALAEQAAARGHQVFCRFSDGDSSTFGSLDEASSRFATGLAKHDVGPHDRVMILARNRLEFLIAFYGVQKRRAIFVPINTELRGAFLQHQIKNCSPKVIIADRLFSEGLDPSVLADVSLIVSIEDNLDCEFAGKVIRFDDLCVATENSALCVPGPQDDCLIIYTSGTSGPSKGVLIPQAHAYLFGLQQKNAVAATDSDIYFVCLPMFHVNALLMALGCCLLSGASAYVVPRFSASAWLNEVKISGATVSNMLGTMAEFILLQPASPQDNDHRLRRIMAVPVAKSWADKFEARFGVDLIQVYGMTECNIVSFTRISDELIPGCVGRVSSEFFEVAILDPDTDLPVGPNHIGEISVRPRLGSTFMTSYYGNAETTLRAFRGLWFHTGDAGRFDDQNQLHFVDRMGDCIRRRGENISSFEIEQILLSYPGIAECAVVGVKVEGAGGEDEIKACLVSSDAPIDFTELFEWSVLKLPRYAVPRFMEHYKRLPKTATGKVQKQQLRAAGTTNATWDREKLGLSISRTH
jgi:carnitine-CoA ligase